jgi:FKBP-type peptidyl-prolyl cis-trans isomerase
MKRLLAFAWFITLLLQSCQTEQTVTPQAQLHSDTTSISAFLKSNGIQATKINAGVWYGIDDLGLGIFPVLSDSVTISYTAKLIPSLTEVDNVASTTVLLSGAISGFQQALILFPNESSGRLYLPSGLAFGTSAHKGIPPNANLLYEVKLIGVRGTRLASDTSAIYSYLQNSNIYNTHQDPSGIRYSIDTTATTGQKPSINDSVLVTYTKQILNADTLVTAVTSPVKLALKDQVTAWRIMLPTYVAEGSKIILYTPSGYAYGSSVVAGIPTNSNLVYNIDLIKVIHH